MIAQAFLVALAGLYRTLNRAVRTVSAGQTAAGRIKCAQPHVEESYRLHTHYMLAY